MTWRDLELERVNALWASSKVLLSFLARAFGALSKLNELYQSLLTIWMMRALPILKRGRGRQWQNIIDCFFAFEFEPESILALNSFDLRGAYGGNKRWNNCLRGWCVLKIFFTLKIIKQIWQMHHFKTVFTSENELSGSVNEAKFIWATKFGLGSAHTSFLGSL